MKTIIESRDGRFRATLENAESGVTVRLLRHAGASMGADGAEVHWSQRETFTLDMPFGRACDMVHAQIWPMTDDRPRAWPVR